MNPATDRSADVAVSTVDSPAGPLLVAATPDGVVRIAFARFEPVSQVTDELAEAISPQVVETELGLEGTLTQLDEYFSGRRRTFDMPLDWQLSQGFRRAVLQELVLVGYGETCSYGELARRVGNPGAARAVGTAMATNPIPLIVPCHRVIASDGTFGGYTRGLPWKERLLALEGSLALVQPR